MGLVYCFSGNVGVRNVIKSLLLQGSNMLSKFPDILSVHAILEDPLVEHSFCLSLFFL